MAQVDLQNRWVSGAQNASPGKLDASSAAIATYDMLGKDGSGYYTLWASGVVHAIALEGATAPSSDGLREILMDKGDGLALYDFPVLTGSLTQAMEGKKCTGAVSSGRFGLDVTATGSFVLVKVDVTNQRALCRIAPTHADVA